MGTAADPVEGRDGASEVSRIAGAVPPGDSLAFRTDVGMQDARARSPIVVGAHESDGFRFDGDRSTVPPDPEVDRRETAVDHREGGPVVEPPEGGPLYPDHPLGEDGETVRSGKYRALGPGFRLFGFHRSSGRSRDAPTLPQEAVRVTSAFPGSVGPGRAAAILSCSPLRTGTRRRGGAWPVPLFSLPRSGGSIPRDPGEGFRGRAGSS